MWYILEKKTTHHILSHPAVWEKLEEKKIKNKFFSRRDCQNAFAPSKKCKNVLESFIV